jgi:NAD-dependent dihydropyrimidine dehydrogenase PreA subunit
MEEEFVQNQERLKPADERNEEERSKVGVRRSEAWGCTACRRVCGTDDGCLIVRLLLAGARSHKSRSCSTGSL